MNLFKIIKYQLYLLQLENYELGRYFRLLFQKGLWPKGEQRKQLVWTMKARAVYVLATILHLGLPIILYWVLSGGFLVHSMQYTVLSILIFVLLATVYCLLFTLALTLLWPLDWLVKKIIVKRAQLKTKRIKNLKIIGIAGSYGKTTMKEVLHTVLSTQYTVHSTPESVNTEVGIARWVLKNVGSIFPSPALRASSPKNPHPAFGHLLPKGEGNIEVAIIEMGEHYKGDIKDICDIANPDIAVVTGINEAHLERMKTLENITSTIFEVVSNAKPGAMVVLNGDDKNVTGHYKEYVWPDHKLLFFGTKNKSNFQFSRLHLPSARTDGGQAIFNFQFNTEKLGWDAEVSLPVFARSEATKQSLSKEEIAALPMIARNDNEKVKVFVNLLGEYALADVDAAIKIARSLGMTAEEIKRGIENIKPVEHRLEPIRSAGDVLVIDDSYNGNPQGAAEAIKVLSRFTNRRKVYITPGLVETGSAAPEIHREIGRQLSNVADVVILIKNSVTPWIAEALASTLQTLSPGDGESWREVENQNQPLPNPLQFLERGTNRNLQLYWFNTAPEAHLAIKNIVQPNDVVLFQNDWGDQYV